MEPISAWSGKEVEQGGLSATRRKSTAGAVRLGRRWLAPAMDACWTVNLQGGPVAAEVCKGGACRPALRQQDESSTASHSQL